MSVDPADPIALAVALVRAPSVTPDAVAALDVLATALAPLGFEVSRPTFRAPGTPDVPNLHAIRRGEGMRQGGRPHLAFAGHVDVVPPGDAADWSREPFSGEVADGWLHGRGSVDMKSGVAAFVSAVARRLAAGDPVGTVSLIVTGDEEGPAICGTGPLLDWMAERDLTPDACIVGEPTSGETFGDRIKIGRRGSLTGTLTVRGVQGHAAYPHRADNPVRGMTVLLNALLGEPFDHGTERFEPTNLEVTTVDVCNPAANVIPAAATATFNIRHNDRWTADTLKTEIGRRLERAASADTPVRRRDDAVRHAIEWREPASECFLTDDPAFIGVVRDAVEGVTGAVPELSTGGGTSDARFVKDHCPVVELGIVGRTMHEVDERASVAEIEALTRAYGAIIGRFAGDGETA